MTSSTPPKTGAISPPSEANSEDILGVIVYKPKGYLQKVSLLDKPRPLHLFREMLRPLLFLSLPSVVYAGFLYGSNLV
jgi:hypothetical protein